MTLKDRKERVEIRLNDFDKTGKNKAFDAFTQEYDFSFNTKNLFHLSEYIQLVDQYNLRKKEPDIENIKTCKYFEKLLSLEWNNLSTKLCSMIYAKYAGLEFVSNENLIQSVLDKTNTYGLIDDELEVDCLASYTMK